MDIASNPNLEFRRRLARRKRAGRIFAAVTFAATLIGLIVLAVLLLDVLNKSRGWLDWQFLTSFPSRFPQKAGILSAFAGSLWLVGLTAIFAFPIGVAAAIYLEEYAPQNWVTNLIQINIANLAGVPSIVYGLWGLIVFRPVIAPVETFLAARFGWLPVLAATGITGGTIFFIGIVLAMMICKIRGGMVISTSVTQRMSESVLPPK